MERKSGRLGTLEEAGRPWGLCARSLSRPEGVHLVGREEGAEEGCRCAEEGTTAHPHPDLEADPERARARRPHRGGLRDVGGPGRPDRDRRWLRAGPGALLPRTGSLPHHAAWPGDLRLVYDPGRAHPDGALRRCPAALAT